jgi:CRP-like cAMP-binding protein
MANAATDQLRDLLENLMPISDLFFEELSAMLNQEHFTKGRELPAVITKKAAVMYVHSGLFKSSYYDKQGKEVVTGFWWEGALLTTKIPTRGEDAEEYTFLEDTTIITIPSAETEYLTTNYPEARRLAQAIYTQERLRLRKRAGLLILPVADAYDAFQETFPANRIKLQDIARFLGIRPFTLSRIRNGRR